jgi:hypothetical protein
MKFAGHLLISGGFRSEVQGLFGIELMHMIRKGQLMEGCDSMSFAY